MRWTPVVWASCLLPVLAGCGGMSRVVRCPSATDDCGLMSARRGAEEDCRRGARGAWETVRGRHAQRTFSDEFRDGFVDGYADFLNRGEAAQAPAVPPVPYARYKKYFGPDGHGLVRDYYLGFKYGGEVAVASGHRSALVVPALPDATVTGEPGAPKPLAVAPPKPPAEMVPPPRPVPDTGKFGEPKKKGSDDLLPPPPALGQERAIPPLPKPELPVIKPFNPDLSGGKLTPLPVPSDPERLPVPNPPLPVLEPLLIPLAVPSDEPKCTSPPILGPIPVMKVTLPTGPERPLLLTDIPVVPLRELPK